MIQVANLTRGSLLAERAVLGTGFGVRLRGLMFRREFAPFDALWLAPTAEIHMFWVRFPIDLVWLDGELRVVAVVEAIRPWRLARCRGAASVLEAPVATIRRTQTAVGDALAFGSFAGRVPRAG